tara:strand:- start:975 stop:1130 length:156 start_codon:yes stop_codon:yes gene_type:complete
MEFLSEWVSFVANEFIARVPKFCLLTGGPFYMFKAGGGRNLNIFKYLSNPK